MTNSEKVALHRTCISLLEEKVITLKRSIKDAQESAYEDGKGSSDDEYDTSREMIQQEIDKQEDLLLKTTLMIKNLKEVDPRLPLSKIEYGSLVKTNEGMYFFSVSLGKVVVEGKTYFVVSLISPIGKAMEDKRVGEKVEFMGRKISIEEIV